MTLRIGPSAALFLAALPALWLLAGCASSPRTRLGDPSLPEIDVLQLKEQSDEALKLSQENKLEIQALQAKLGELEVRISSLGDEVASLPISKLEELTQQVALVAEQLRLLEERAGKPVAGAPAPKGISTFSPGKLDSAGRTPPGAKAPAPSRGGAKAAVPPKGAPGKPQVSDAEAQLYKKAFDLFYGKDYAQAILKFEELLAKFPAGSYADNCHYWVGECHFAMGNFAKAIVGFRKVLTFTDTEKADDAQLKLGYCLLRLGDRKRAAEEFKKVVSLYPDSEYLERAKEELAKLE